MWCHRRKVCTQSEAQHANNLWCILLLSREFQDSSTKQGWASHRQSKKFHYYSFLTLLLQTTTHHQKYTRLPKASTKGSLSLKNRTDVAATRKSPVRGTLWMHKALLTHYLPCYNSIRLTLEWIKALHTALQLLSILNCQIIENRCIDRQCCYWFVVGIII